MVTYSWGIDDDGVFRALADAGRRRLLDALFEADGRTLGELCAVLPVITRFGVMKHLGVLEGAGLVVTHRSGRNKLHYLNPVPIQEIQERWITKYARPTVAAMVGLRRHLENGACPENSHQGGEPTPCDSAFVSTAEPAEQARRDPYEAGGWTCPLKP